MIVEIHGVEVFGHHGVGEQERRQGQTFLVASATSSTP